MADAPDPQRRTLRYQRYAYLVGGLLLGVVATWIAMSSIRQAPPALYPGGAAPLGYTKSLILFILPVAAMGLWFVRPEHRRHRHWRPFGYTVVVIALLWTVLDILFALRFFVFPDPEAGLGIYIPGLHPETGWGFNVPIEEVFFYILGSLYLVLAYIWMSEAWFPEKDLDDQDYDGHWPDSLWKVVKPSYLVWGGIAVIAVIAIKRFGLFGADQAGFPGYAVYLILIIALPAAMLFSFEFRFINLPAFLVTVLSILLIGILWEVTLALPYGWWNYQATAMIGIFIRPWSNLPIEAAFLWAAAAWSNVAIYELFRIFYHRKETPDLPSAATKAV